MQRYQTFLKCILWEYPSILVESTTNEIWALKENTKYQLLQYLVPSTTTKILFTKIESYINLILPPSLCSLCSFFLLSQITLKVQKWYFPHFSFILLSDCEGIKRHIGQKFSFNYRNTSLLRFHLSCPHSQKIWVNHKLIQAGRLYFEVHLYFPKVRGQGVFHCDFLGIWSDEIKDKKIPVIIEGYVGFY